jgi:HEAT repeat protein
MSFYPELDNLSLTELISRWNNELPEEYECANTYYGELASLILDKDGSSGHDYLLSVMSHELTPARIGAVLFLMPSPENPLPKEKLLRYLHESDSYVVSCTIRGLTQQGEKDAINDVLALKSHASPQVRSSVLDFVSKLCPELAVSLLIKSLKDSSHIVRESAIDELDYLQVVKAIDDIKPLLTDTHPFTRQAAQTAIKNLEAYEESL